MEHGANPNLESAGGWTVMHFAATAGRRGSVRLLEYFVAKGLDPDVLDGINFTPLDWVEYGAHNFDFTTAEFLRKVRKKKGPASK
jgi:ankyrin repeat protein